MDMSAPHAIGFFSVMATEAGADTVAKLYLADEAPESVTVIETRPYEEGGMELFLKVQMVPTYENVTQFQDKLKQRMANAAVEGYTNGWGMWNDAQA